MNSPPSEELQKEIGQGEHLIWSGRPRQGLLLRASDALMIPFSLLWGGFAFFWEFSVSAQKNTPFFFDIWGFPFVLVGIYIIAGRFFVDSYQRSQTYYGLTEQRAIILTGMTTRETKSLYLQNLNEVSLSECSDRSGSILFGSVPPMYAMWQGTSWPGMSKKLVPSFDMIEDAHKVYELIKKAQNTKK